MGARSPRWRIGLLVLGLGACEDGGPRLERASPDAAVRGGIVTLTGARLCGEAGGCATAGGEIQIGFNPPVVLARIVAYADTEAQIQIPSVAEVGPTSLIATVNELSSNALDFEILPGDLR